MKIFNKDKKEINTQAEENIVNEKTKTVEESIENPNSYNFITPLVIGAESTGELRYLKEIIFREPTSGDLRGLTLVKIFESDVDSWLVLLSRITTPNISIEFLKRMNLNDMANLIAKVLDFLPSRVNTQVK